MWSFQLLFLAEDRQRCTTWPFFFMAREPLVGQGRLIIEISRSHSVRLICMSDQPDAQTSTWQHITLTRDGHPCHGGIRTRNPSKRAASYQPTTRQHTKFTKAFITSKMSYDCTVHSKCVVSRDRKKVNGIFRPSPPFFSLNRQTLNTSIFNSFVTNFTHIARCMYEIRIEFYLRPNWSKVGDSVFMKFTIV